MHLLLAFITFSIPVTSMSQSTDQADHTTESGHLTQTNSISNFVYNTSMPTGLDEQTETKMHFKSTRPDDITPSGFLDSGNVNQSFVTTAEDIQNVTMDHATSSNTNLPEYVSYDFLNNHHSALTTPQSLGPQTMSQSENFSVNTTFQSSEIVDSTNSPREIPAEDFISVTSDNILSCLNGSETLHLKSTGGQIWFFQGSFNKSETCVLEIIVPVDMVIQMIVLLNTTCPVECPYGQYCPAFVLTVSDEPANFDREFDCYSTLQRVVSPGHRVVLQLEAYPTNASIELSFNFTAVPPPQLEVIFLTPSTGYVQSPGWDGKTKYPSHLDIRTHLDVPSNCSMMVSFHAMDIEGEEDCIYDHLTIYVEDSKLGGESVELIHCNLRQILKPTVFHTNVLSFRFVSDETVEYLGFRLYFSFHNQSETPEKLSDGKWNCSVPFWPNFQSHFNCNKVVDCFGEEDENHCGYAVDGCDKGFISIGSRCYTLISGEEHVTWNEAANECLRREAYLASLNSPEEWEEVMNFVKDVLEPVYFGLQISGQSLPDLYRDRFQWADGSIAFYANVYYNYYDDTSARCCVLLREYRHILMTEQCNKNMTTSFLCEKNMQSDDLQEKPQDIVLHPLQWQGNGDNYVTCPSGHATLTILACDPQSACWAGRTDVSTTACEYPGKPPPPSLQCMSGVDSVPYTLVCDHRPDCSDSSDENFCVFPSCQMSGMFQCTNKQCVPYKKRCDKVLHCLDGSDETHCPWYYRSDMLTPVPPAIVYFDGYGSYEVNPLIIHTNESNTSNSGVCPETHFLCPGNLTYCMPVFVRCNGVYDCPGRQDEDGCDRYQCPGYYRCRASPVCVHASHLCDGVFQCPQHDDELLCEATCPQNCTCQGLAFYCHGQFPAEQYHELRFLHAPESELHPERLKHNFMLIYLNLAKCRLESFDNMDIPNLRILDLSYNNLVSFRTSQLINVNNLQKLSLSGNPLKFPFVIEYDSPSQFPLLQTLDLSNISLPELNVTLLSVFPKLTFLNLSACGVKHIAGEGFQSLAYLRYLDLRGCPITDFPKSIFSDLNDLKEVWADNYKLCCQVALPENFLLRNCHSPADEISSCEALLRSDFYRVVLSVFAAMALTGNLGSFVYRVFINRASSSLGFGVFVTHLCVSDFLMGVYLAVIGIADRVYQGNYLWKDEEWKQSAGCKVAGFLSLLSSEVSAFIICLITLDRFIVIRFPFTNIYFKRKSAHVACMVVWLIGIMMAVIPLLPFTKHWKFYSQNGICIPLPITRQHSDHLAGRTYSFSIIIIVNFILFILIAAGQMFIYWSVRTNRISAGDSNKKSNDLVVARRLITIAMSDFLCWFPIGLLGLLASNDVSIPGEINVAIAIITLPVNSAINPFLYTINSLLEKRRKADEQRIHKMIMSSLSSKHTERASGQMADKYTQQEALCLISKWLSKNLLSPQHIEKIVLGAQENQKHFKQNN